MCRPRLVRLLIVGEGRETEYNYFDALRREDLVKDRFAITLKKGKGGTREQIAQHAIERNNEAPDNYDHSFCVMDVEKETQAASLSKALVLLKRKGIVACLSNPSFEIWFVAHFERTCASFLNASAALAYLNGHWQKHFGCAYDKSCPHHYSRLATRRPAAINHARYVREKDHPSRKRTGACNSCTDVYRLVGWLIDQRRGY